MNGPSLPKPIKKATLGFGKNPRKPMKRGKLRVAGHSTTSEIKRDIQALLREIVILRDKKCILYGIKCRHEVGMEGLVWQAEHLIERSNSATYGDSRLVVLVEKSCHYWKHITDSNKEKYDEWLRPRLSKERVELWDKCKKDSWRTSKMDWKLVKLQLEQELNKLKQ